ncbi:uncharacterized protein ACA1_209770 [Acanthamoeba castellanii str. Neff]|uniref:Uncharacterized protein n=1 Tax=Acanthamoeba castellanii (strain ATCC 30010 / Neff) TaxID=1257118 RepID=L8GYG7_ACACF|nr:uncharacterized protein ACA1_209770 [Acanthamoeba castellanii str. Neff]ELR18002.1 hypothetical protein ACA1_209770 [Acanthamoeba castellanii str. Neff]
MLDDLRVVRVAPVNRENHETVECTAKVVACRAADVGCEFACEHEDKCVVVVLRTILQRQRDAMQQLSRSIEEQQTTLRQQQGEIAALKKQVKALKTRKKSSSDAGSLSSFGASAAPSFSFGASTAPSFSFGASTAGGTTPLASAEPGFGFAAPAPSFNFAAFTAPIGVSAFSAPAAGNFPGQFYKPRGVAADSTSGNIVVADTANHRL